MLDRNEACLGVLPGTAIACGEYGYCSNECLIIGSFNAGAAVAFGLMGMAEAIRAECLCPNCGCHLPLTPAWFSGRLYREVCHCENDE